MVFACFSNPIYTQIFNKQMRHLFFMSIPFAIHDKPAKAVCNDPYCVSISVSFQLGKFS